MSKIRDFIFVRDKHVCPWWLCFTFDNIFRRLIQDPVKILRPYIKTGDMVLDTGPGMGYFTIPLAQMVGEKGRVIAADIQERMLLALAKRAEQAGVEKRIIMHLCYPDSLGVQEKVNFVLAFWMVHEVPDKQRFMNELFSVLQDNGKFLLVEPLIHVTENSFESTVKSAIKAGFALGEKPKIFASRTALLVKLAENKQSAV
jgi:ubiquinone/menaquinone biosynthesis C-methylase UbiE